MDLGTAVYYTQRARPQSQRANSAHKHSPEMPVESLEIKNERRRGVHGRSANNTPYMDQFGGKGMSLRTTERQTFELQVMYSAYCSGALVTSVRASATVPYLLKTITRPLRIASVMP